jgi:hypothetical protein
VTVDPILYDNEWQAIVEAISPLPPGVDLERARWELEVVKQDFAGFPSVHPVVARKRWARIDRLIAELAVEIREVKARVPWSADDPLWPNRLLAALWPVKQKAELHVEGFTILARAIQGKRDPVRDWLYWRLLAIWTDCLGGELTISVPKYGGQPCGPLVRFLIAAVTVVSGKAPNAYTVRTIVRRERARRGKKG